MFITSQHINFAYTAKKTVLNDISFSLNKGETLAIVGASGCGKSTLLRILSGILPNSNGNSLQGDISIDGLTPDQYRQTGKLAFMFQEATLMPHLTVKQNIGLPLKIKGNNDEQKINTLIKAVGLEEYNNYLPKQLSGGMKTRVALARSFSTNPELLLLDEPFSALDIAWKSKLYVELEKLKEETTTTVVIVTHDVQEALLLADKVFILGKRGVKLFYTTVAAKYPIMSRLNDISKFNNTEQFQLLYSAIQKFILVDGLRAITESKEANAVFTAIQSVAGYADMEEWDGIENDINSIRKYTNNSQINELLFSSFEKAKTVYFKYNLVWDILEFRNISKDKIESVKQFYLDNIETNSAFSLPHYQLNATSVFEHLVKNKIEVNRFPETKRWIYLCDMYASSETDKVLQYLEAVENGIVELLNYPLAKEVAQQVSAKIKNEKQDTLHIA
ncbi:MAG: ABC transporter ATP-binding protein [Lacibacter sp.]